MLKSVLSLQSNPENITTHLDVLCNNIGVRLAAGFIADITQADKLPYQRKIPAKQVSKIKRNWQDLFGGWKN